jgi:long-chain fatty acid transport protein
MKKSSAVFIYVLVFIIQVSVLSANSIDYNSNQSAKYYMNPARTASTDGADIAAYNPAGTAYMKPGLYIDVSEQFLMRNYEQDVSDGTLAKRTYKQDEPAYIYPNLFMVYNFGKTGPGKLAVYANAGVIGGGGSVKWNGTAGYDEMALYLASYVAGLEGICNPISIRNRVEASSLYIGIGAGVSYSLFKDIISISLGGRFVHSERDFQINGELQFFSTISGTWNQYYNSKWNYNADGGSPIFGLDIRPFRNLTVGIRYEAETKLKFEYEQTDNVANNNALNGATNTGASAQINSMFNMDGKKLNNNLPDILSLGVEYGITHRLAVSASGTFYDLSKADMNGFEEYCSNGWETSLGVTYKFSKSFKAGTGLTYTDIGVKESLPENLQLLKRYSLNPLLNSLMYGLGVTYTLWNDFDITLSGAYTYYFPENNNHIGTAYGANMDISYRKNIYAAALGVSCKL